MLLYFSFILMYIRVVFGYFLDFVFYLGFFDLETGTDFWKFSFLFLALKMKHQLWNVGCNKLTKCIAFFLFSCFWYIYLYYYKTLFARSVYVCLRWSAQSAIKVLLLPHRATKRFEISSKTKLLIQEEWMAFHVVYLKLLRNKRKGSKWRVEVSRTLKFW